MKNFSFLVPTGFNHLFVDYSEDNPKYYLDKDLKELIPDNENVTEIKTMLPAKLSKIEMSKVVSKFENGAETINYFHLWPFSHMKQADIIVDGEQHSSFSLYNDRQKTHYRETMENLSWESSLFIIYAREDNSKIGFLLFR